MRALILLLALLIAASAQAEVYKWVDEKGVVHYTDEPPPNRKAKPAQLPKLQTYKQGTLPSLDDFGAAAGPAPTAAGATSVRIVSPAPEQTFRDPSAPVPVSVEVTPALGEGQMLVYKVDGAPQGGPTPSTSFAVTGLERGAHSVSVAIVDASGKELLRSGAVTVHIKPPIAR